VNYRKYVYFWDNGEMVIAFPGGKECALSMLRGKIVPPERLRFQFKVDPAK